MTQCITKYLAGLLLLVMVLSAEAQNSIGTVLALQGQAQAADVHGQLRELQLQSDIFEMDTITTGADSKLQIMFNDNALLSQGPDSCMTMDEYVYNPENEEECGFATSLFKGLFRVVTGSITDKNPDRFNVKTGRSTIGIRGCEVGCKTGGAEDIIYVVRIPKGKSIGVDPLKDGVPDRAYGMVLRRPGVVTVDMNGRLHRRSLEPGDLTALQNATTPDRAESIGRPAPSDGQNRGPQNMGDRPEDGSGRDASGPSPENDNAPRNERAQHGLGDTSGEKDAPSSRGVMDEQNMKPPSQKWGGAMSFGIESSLNMDSPAGDMRFPMEPGQMPLPNPENVLGPGALDPLGPSGLQPSNADPDPAPSSDSDEHTQPTVNPSQQTTQSATGKGVTGSCSTMDALPSVVADSFFDGTLMNAVCEGSYDG